MDRQDSSAVFELRPLPLADLLDAVWRLYRRHFGSLVPITAVVYLPVGIVYAVATGLMRSGFMAESGEPALTQATAAGIAGLGLAAVLYVLTIPIMQAAMAKAVSELYLGGTPSVGDVYRFALARFPSLLGVALLYWLIASGVYFVVAIAGGVASLGVGLALEAAGGGVASDVGIFVMMIITIGGGLLALAVVIVRLFAAPVAVVLEDYGAAGALGRSWELTQGRFWYLAVALLVLYLFVQVFIGIVVWPLSLSAGYWELLATPAGEAIQIALWLAAEIIFQPISIVGTVLLYYDLRIRREAFDLTMMAQAIGEPEMAPNLPAPPPSGAPLFDVRAAEDEHSEAPGDADDAVPS